MAAPVQLVDISSNTKIVRQKYGDFCLRIRCRSKQKLKKTSNIHSFLDDHKVTTVIYLFKQKADHHYEPVHS